jgi:hypothetical protein
MDGQRCLSTDSTSQRGGQVSKPRLRDRIAARRAAREIWFASQSDSSVKDLLGKAVAGDEEAGKLLFASHPEMPRGIDPATLFVLIQLAIKLWIWWQGQNKQHPSAYPEVGEPFDGSDDDDTQP